MFVILCLNKIFLAFRDILEELDVQLEIVSKSSLDFRARREQVIGK